MKFLITRCTTYDMAGVAMINGAINGLKCIFDDAEFSALMVNGSDIAPHPELVDQRNHKEFEEMITETDCCIDLGGLVKGYDPYRHEYIKLCREKDKPYIYLAVSFEHPDPEIVKNVPATARGINSAEEYKKMTGDKLPPVVPDISFLIDPVKLSGGEYLAFTTHKGKPWASFINVRNEAALLGLNMMQVIFKPPSNGITWEPPLDIENFHGSPEELYGAIIGSSYLRTCRYHAGVAAIMGGVPYEIPIGMPNANKYKDLNTWRSMNLAAIRSHAGYSCEFVREIIYG